MYEIAKKQGPLLRIFTGIFGVFTQRMPRKAKMADQQTEVQKTYPVMVKFLGVQPRVGSSVTIRFTKSVNHPQVAGKIFSGTYSEEDRGVRIIVPEIVKDFPHVYVEMTVNRIAVERYFKLVDAEFIVELRSFGTLR